MDLDTLRQLRQQRYDPTSESLSETALDRFEKKSFRDSDIAERFHEATKAAERRPRATESAQRFVTDPSLLYAQARLSSAHSGADRIELPPPSSLSESLTAALANRRSRRAFTGEPLPTGRLSTLLAHSLGVTDHRELDSGVERPFRAYASGGGLYPVECYVLLSQPNDALDAGLYHYDPRDHVLYEQRTADADFHDDVEAVFEPGSGIFDVQETGAVLLLTGVFERSKAKYGVVGHQFVLQESGHMAQNLQLVATAMDLASFPNASYDDHRADEFLEVNGVDESTIYTIPLGFPEGEADV
ncbi:MAG: SagB/ThcOx family dehydrogenase [Haloarcula sp.]